MAEEQEKDGGEIHTIGTVPPPPDGDAYDAPTKVGEVSSAVWRAIAPHLQGEAKLAPPRTPSFTADEVKAADPTPTADATAKVAPISMSNLPALSSGELPQMYDDDESEGEGDNATLLHPSAKRFPLPPPVMPPPRAAAFGDDAQAIPPPASLPIPEMVGPGPDDKVWPFAPALVEPDASNDRKQAAIVAIAAAVVGVLVAIILWRLWH